MKAGGGRLLTIGEMCQMMLSKLDWFGTLFPRIPIPIQVSVEYSHLTSLIRAGDSVICIYNKSGKCTLSGQKYLNKFQIVAHVATYTTSNISR